MLGNRPRSPQAFNPNTGQFLPLATPPDLPRMSVMRVREIHEDYLLCEGWDPDLHGYVREVFVAKPPLLRAGVSRPGFYEPAKTIRFPDRVETVSAPAEGESDTQFRRVTFKNSIDDPQPSGGESQRVSPKYFVGELIVAAKMKTLVGDTAVYAPVTVAGVVMTPSESTAPDGWPMKPLPDTGGAHIYWQDLNIAGRRWDSPPKSSFSLIVNVRNDTSEDWTQWDIVRVHEADGVVDMLDNPPPGEMQSLTFSGTRWDDYAINAGTWSDKLGVTQVPIAAGEVGEVCIRGATYALVWDIWSTGTGGTPWTDFGKVTVEKEAGRWKFQFGAGGEADVIGVLGPSDSQWYADENNDSFLAIIDIQPDWVMRAVTGPYPRNSIVSPAVAWAGDIDAIPSTSTNQWERAVCPDQFALYQSPGWTVSAAAVAAPMRRIKKGEAYCCETAELSTAVGSVHGVASGRLWAGLAGFVYIGRHLLTRGSGYDGPPKYGWFQYAGGTPDVFAKMYDLASQTIYLRSEGGNLFDDHTHGGIVYPKCQPLLEFFENPLTQDWNFKKHDAANMYFWGTGVVRNSVASVGMRFRPASLFHDDPVGTIKIWGGGSSLIPDGWHLCDGTHGTPDLTGKFVLGASASTVGSQGGTGTHSHSYSVVSAAAGTDTGFIIADPLSTEGHIPPYYALAYIMRTDE